MEFCYETGKTALFAVQYMSRNMVNNQVSHAIDAVIAVGLSGSLKGHLAG